MDIKCNINPNYLSTPSPVDVSSFRGKFNASRLYQRVSMSAENMVEGLSADKFVRRPVASESATGLLGLVSKGSAIIKEYAQNYKKNIKHTFEHKVVFALVEKELFGKRSVDSITHDLDKLILYTLGFPKSFVSKFHRQISEHHTESGKKNNLRSMLCDNIASSPEFKPEKRMSLREYYNSSKELQSVKGFKEILEEYNYGENLSFDGIKLKKEQKLENAGWIKAGAACVAGVFAAFMS